MYLKVLAKHKQAKPQINRWKDIVKIREEVNEIKTKKYNTNNQ
jgi:hypothetical protein